MPSTLTPPMTVPISAAAPVVMMVRRLEPEPKLLGGDLVSDMGDLSVSQARPMPIVDPTRGIATAFRTTGAACLDDPAVPRAGEFSRAGAAIARRSSAGPPRQRRDRKR